MPIHVFVQHSMNKVFFLTKLDCVAVNVKLWLRLRRSCRVTLEAGRRKWRTWSDLFKMTGNKVLSEDSNSSSVHQLFYSWVGGNHKARYTPATKLNSTRSTLLKVDCCRNQQQSRLSPYTVDFVAIRSTLWPVLATNRQQRKIRQLVAVDFVADTVNFVADTFNFVAGFGNKSATTWIRQHVAVDIVADTVNCVADTVDFVASVYGAKATRSTFNKSTVLNSTLSPVCTGLYGLPVDVMYVIMLVNVYYTTVDASFYLSW